MSRVKSPRETVRLLTFRLAGTLMYGSETGGRETPTVKRINWGKRVVCSSRRPAQGSPFQGTESCLGLTQHLSPSESAVSSSNSPSP